MLSKFLLRDGPGEVSPSVEFKDRGPEGHQQPLGSHNWPLASPHLQDEMELGYVQAPHKTLPVVFDSPRNGELQDFPYKRILVSGPRLQPTPES